MDKSTINLANYCCYWPYPPIGGGPLRIHNLNKVLSHEINIKQYSFRPTNSNKISVKNIFKPKEIVINSNYSEFQYLSIPSSFVAFVLSRLNLPHDIFQSSILKRFHITVDLNADLIQVEHPWLFKYIYSKNKGKLPIILTAHNFEYNLCEDLILKKNPHFKFILKKIRQIEIEALLKADIVFSVSPIDIDQFVKLGVDKKKIHLIPNGVDISKYDYASPSVKQKLKDHYGFSGKKVILFTGTIHYPNIEAVRIIENIAKEFDDNVVFLVVGKAGNGFKSTSNFVCTGFVDDISDYIKMADIGINPLNSGSGTNLKMLEYLAAGLPTVTTPTGARGLDLVDGENIIISDIERFPDSLNLLFMDESLNSRIRIQGRKLVETKYDWNVIANKMMEVYHKIGERGI